MQSDRIEVLVFRHGETDWNHQQRLQGHTDIPLNETGREQARVLASKLQHHNPEVILTSDLSRARETAEIVNRSRNLPVVEFADLRECKIGDPEGFLIADIVELYGEEDWVRWRSADPADQDFGFPNGETKRQHLERLLGCLERFVASRPELKSVALSTHGGCIRRLIQYCEDAPLYPIPLPNCVLYRIWFDPWKRCWIYGGAIE